MQTIIVIIVVAAAAFFTVRKFYRGFRGREGCGCGCEGRCEDVRSCNSFNQLLVDDPEHCGRSATPGGSSDVR
ncbi:MAG TPA: FeoB-associated Cys-rich membrane protein [Desulfobacterales bacterium]